MGQIPARTPPVVIAAVNAYVRRQKLVRVTAWLGLGAGLAGLTALAFMLVDRLIEWSPAGRAIGPWLALLLLAGGVLLSLLTLLQRWSIRTTAITLDQEVAGNQDRWGTSLDVAERMARGEPVGLPAWIDRLLDETQSSTSPTHAARVVSRRPAWIGLGAVGAAVATLLCLMLTSFNLPLLWQRFLQPSANLPRDSYVKIVLLEMNSQPIQLKNDMLPAVPQSSPLTLRLSVTDPRSTAETAPKGLADAGTAAPAGPTPRIEQVDEKGQVIAQLELVQTGQHWTLSQPSLESPLRFRVRAGDGLTQQLTVPVQQRIKFTRIDHSIRYPSYAKQPEVRDQPLEAARLTLLEGTQLAVTLECDGPIEQLHATFELLDGPGPAAPTTPVPILPGMGGAPAAEPAPQPRDAGGQKVRELPVKLRRSGEANFNLRVDQGGILRIQAVGENGLPSLEKVCVIEAVRDAPPRISVSGLRPDTQIVPGELVGFAYTAEDDLGVADVIMDWTVAGHARTGDLSGEEYLRNEQMGQKVVSGQETIQRMNYKIYGTSPFEFTLIVIDSKGQESRSSVFNIHLLSDSFAARFAAGLQFYTRLQNASNQSLSRLRHMANQLNIVAAAVGDSETWPTGQDKLLDGYLSGARHAYSGLELESVEHQFSGWPYRLQNSVAQLLAVHAAMHRSSDWMQAAVDLRQSKQAPADVAALKSRIEQEIALVEQWKAAILAEQQRFAAEGLLQEVRNIRQRLGRLDALKGSAQLYNANLTFYRDQAAKAAEGAAKLPEEVAAAVKQEVDQLAAVASTAEADQLLAALRQLEMKLQQYNPSPTQQLVSLLDSLQQQALNDTSLAQRLHGGIAKALAQRETDAGSNPLEDLQLAQLWMGGDISSLRHWHQLPTQALDLWLLGQQLLDQIEAHLLNASLQRYALNPEAGDDVEADLREQALQLRDVLSRINGVDPQQASNWQNVLALVSAGGLESTGEQVTRQLRELLASVEPAAVKHLQQQVAQMPALLGSIATSLQRTAGQFRQLGDRIQMQHERIEAGDNAEADLVRVTLQQQAQMLQNLPRVAEIAYRTAQLLRMTQLLRSADPAGWEQWSPWHSVGLLLMLDGHNAYQKVAYRFGRRFDPKTYPVIAQAARDFAAELESHAGVIDRLRQGQPLAFDFSALEKENKAVGYLEGARKEYQLLLDLLQPASAEVAQETFARLRTSALGKIIWREQLLTGLLAAKRAVQQAQSSPDHAIATLGQLEQLLTRRSDASMESLLQQVQALRAGSQVSTEDLKELAESLGHEIESLLAAVQLPAIAMTRQANQRALGGVAVQYWMILGIIENFDRRWAYRMRGAELAMVREMMQVAAAGDDTAASASADLMRRYAKLVEYRARQLAQDRRRNSGISYLAAEQGTGLKLPPHIAQELMRARMQQLPELFKRESELYYERLFEGLSE